MLPDLAVIKLPDFLMSVHDTCCHRHVAALQAMKTKIVEPFTDAVRVLEVVWRHAAMMAPGVSVLSRSIFNCISNDATLQRALNPVRLPLFAPPLPARRCGLHVWSHFSTV